MAKVALLIGVSEYEPGLNPLPGAVRDVEAIREVLLHAEIGGFASQDVILLKNPERQDMEEAIESLFSGRMKDDLVLLYFSGHGIKDDTNRLYLTTRTTRKTERGELIRSTAVAARKLQQYEQAYVNATQRRHYLSEGDRTQLDRTWRTLGLKEEDVRAISTRINAEIAAYQANLRQYEHEFVEATQQQYPLSEGKRRELKQRQQVMSLSDKDVGAIESRITAEIEEYRQKIQQYEQVFAESIQYEYPLTDETRKELKRFQHVLELSNEDVAQIEEQILESGETVPNSEPESPVVEQMKVVEAIEADVSNELLEQRNILQPRIIEEQRSQQVSLKKCDTSPSVEFQHAAESHSYSKPPIQLLEPPQEFEVTPHSRGSRQRNRYLVFIRRTIATVAFVSAAPFLLTVIVYLFSSSANFPDIFTAITVVVLGVGLVGIGIYLWRL
jgi:Caspase domain